MKTYNIALVVGLTSVLAACGGSSSDNASASAGSNTPAPVQTTASVAPTASTEPAGPPAAPGTANCIYTADPNSPTGGKKPSLPSGVADTTKSYTVTMVTNHGTIVIALDAKAAPCTVNSFVSLIKQGFYDNTPCHRLLDGLSDGVLQCGDPTGTGQGGPGYSFADENLAGATYPKGEIAMANAGPNTNGSQFFMMFKDSTFQPDYTPFGHLLSGVDVLTQIAAGGTSVSPETGSPDVPKTKTTIEKVTVVIKGSSTSSPKPKSTPKATKSATPSASATASAQ